MTSTELADELSKAALAYRGSADPATFERLENLTREAAAYVQAAGERTVGHIVLSSILRLIVADVPALEKVLRDAGWHWLP